MKFGARGRQGGRQAKFENKHTKEEFDLLTCLLQSSVRISRPKKEGMSDRYLNKNLEFAQRKYLKGLHDTVRTYTCTILHTPLVSFLYSAV